ncbi:MAG TPA: peptidoglycan DD-metalloendopeptidase family protein [Candidatus Limnocylindrales bacterium]|nr:peptidoglycan DD-metalloendopeptidase family protein [Candidatus Limnocylindrales bacterium]
MRAALVALALALLVAGADRSGVSADSTPTDPQQQLAIIEQIRAQLGSNLADAMAAQQQLRQSLLDNAAQQQVLQGKISDVEAKIADLNWQIADAVRREAILTRQIEAERAQLRQLSRAIYVAPDSVLVVLAESRSLSDLLTRISDLNVAGARAGEIKGQLTGDLNELQIQRKKEEAARAEQIKQRDLLDKELAQLQALQAQQEESMAQLDEKIAETRYEIGQLNTQSTQLAQAVTQMLQQQQDAIIAAAMQAVWTQVQLWTQSNNVGQIPTSSGHSTQYRFIWPEPTAQISQPFGPSTFWFEPPYGNYPHFHTGIDMVAPFGSPAFAADDGIVALVGSSSSGYGNYVVLAHAGGLDTLYAHLSTALVKVGQQVTQGTPVGLEGSSGNSTGPHLHFELRINQVPINPTPYLPPGAPSPFRG